MRQSHSIYGLIGYPLGHSFSKNFFEKKFAEEKIPDVQYNNYPLQDVYELPGLISSNPDIRGLNVTIPYKEKVIPFLDHLDPVSTKIGAVNTIRVEKEGGITVLRGFNTDAYGFNRSLHEILPENSKITGALILGTGGASKAIAYTLRQLNISFRFVSTTKSSAIRYESLNREIIESCNLIINTTPLGTFPDVSSYPDIPYEFLNEHHILFDLVYNPALTIFLRKGQERGSIICNGLPMLEYQALKSWEIWNDLKDSSF